MKKKRITVVLVLVLLLASLLSGCGKQEPIEVVLPNAVYTVDTEKGTISDGMYTYTYEADDNGGTITYPDGSTYWYRQSGMSVISGWSDDYDGEKYASGQTLENVLEKVAEKRKGINFPGILLSLVMFAVGAGHIFAPESAWYISWGWRYKDAEPSDLALTMERIGGVVICIAAVILLITGL